MMPPSLVGLGQGVQESNFGLSYKQHLWMLHLVWLAWVT